MKWPVIYKLSKLLHCQNVFATANYYYYPLLGSMYWHLRKCQKHLMLLVLLLGFCIPLFRERLQNWYAALTLAHVCAYMIHHRPSARPAYRLCNHALFSC